MYISACVFVVIFISIDIYTCVHIYMGIHMNIYILCRNAQNGVNVRRDGRSGSGSGETLPKGLEDG